MTPGKHLASLLNHLLNSQEHLIYFKNLGAPITNLASYLFGCHLEPGAVSPCNSRSTDEAEDELDL